MHHANASPRGKAAAGPDAPFTAIPNGVPGLAACLPLLWSEGVATGRITASDFVRLTAGQPSRLFGLHAKGRIARAPTPTWCCGTRTAAPG